MRLNNFQYNKTAFGSSNNSSRNNFIKLYTACAVAGLVGSGAVYKCAHDDLEQSRENINKICDKYELMYELNKTKRDTIIIEDVTGDNFPELILYKNDGSKVAVDIQDAKKLDVIQ